MPKVLNEVAGHNGGVTENTFFHHLRDYQELKSQASAIAAKIKKRKKSAEEDGIVWADLEQVLKDKNVPVEERIKSHNNRNLYRKFLKMPESQMLPDLDENYSDVTGLTDEQRKEKRRDDGYVAGREGKNRDVCPFDDPNSEAARDWFEGWEAGQAENAKGIKKPKVEKKAADEPKETETATAAPAEASEPSEPKKRGRPKKDAGVTYWHNSEIRKVYEVPQSDAAPAGAENITRSQYETLKAEYEKADDDDWNSAVDANDEPPSASIN